MRLSIEQVAKNIETLTEKTLEGHEGEMNLRIVSFYLMDNGFHVQDEDHFLESLLCRKPIFTLEERLSQHVMEFMGDEIVDRNEGLCFKDVE